MKTTNAQVTNNTLTSTVNAIEDADWSREEKRAELNIPNVEMHYSMLIDSFDKDSHPFLRQVVAGAVISNLSYLIETHYPRKIDQVTAELRELHEMGTKSRAKQGSEVDQAQLERKLNWLAFNVAQLEEVQALYDALQNAHVKRFKQRWVRRDASKKPTASKTSTMAILDHVLKAADGKALNSKDFQLETVFAGK